MNSESHDSAAWRAFGMLDADETAAFDLAMRQDPELRNAYREMESLTAAVAVATTTPIAPRAGQLESLHLRLGIGATRRTNWLGISGWAAAAALAAFLIINNRPDEKREIAINAVTEPQPPIQQLPQKTESLSNELVLENTDEVNLITSESTVEENPSSFQTSELASPIVRVETKRLIQEIEVLREELENFQERDRERFEVVPDVAWPIVMRMSAPRSGTALVRENDTPPLTAMLGDALAAASGLAGENISRNSLALTSTEPSAIPIYDAARDNGTLYVDNLPMTTDDEPYRLWVKTKSSRQAVYVGKLPKSNNRKSEAFDFNLGATATVPSEFILTKDPRGQTNPPSVSNIILQGPSLK